MLKDLFCEIDNIKIFIFSWVSACAYCTELQVNINLERRARSTYLLWFPPPPKKNQFTPLENSKRLKISGKLFHSSGTCILVFYT